MKMAMCGRGEERIGGLMKEFGGRGYRIIEE